MSAQFSPHRCTSGTDVDPKYHDPCGRQLLVRTFKNKQGVTDGVLVCCHCDATHLWANYTQG